VSTHKRPFPTGGFCFLCETDEVELTHYSSVQMRNVCQPCAEALAWAELTFRLEGIRRPSQLDKKEFWDSGVWDSDPEAASGN
jgi:hypothetical protein